MKKIIVLLITCTAMFNYGQAFAFSIENYDSVKIYYGYKYKAEIALMDSNYTLANQLYDSAFLYKEPYVRDAYNALVSAYLTVDSVRTAAYYKYLINIGFEKRLIEFMPFIAEVKNEPFYKNVVSVDSVMSVNPEIIEKRKRYEHIMDSLLAEDQHYRKTHKNNPSLIKINVDSANAVYLNNFVKENGFPGFYLIGATKKFGKRPDHTTIFYILYWHWRGNPNSPLDSIATDAVQKGLMDPCDYAFQRDQSQLRYYQNIGAYRYDTLLLIEIEKIDKLRNAIYLEPLNEYIRKVKFYHQNNMFAFFSLLMWEFNKRGFRNLE